MHADAHTQGGESMHEYMHICGTKVASLNCIPKRDGHTYIHTAAYPWPDPIPRANELSNYTCIALL